MLTRSAWILFSLLAMWQERPSPPPAAQEFRISGIVQDGASGLPLGGAEVSIALSGSPTPDAAVSAVTSAEGRFVFEHLAAGKYLLSAKRRGYAPQNYQQHEFFSTAIAVGPHLDSENIVFELLPAASIAGQVIDESGEAVRRAQVILYAEGRTQGRISVRRRGESQSDDQGHYHFGGLPKGRYYVAVSAHPWYAQNVTAETMAGHEPGGLSRQGIVVFNTLRQVVEQNTSLDVVYPLTFYGNTTESSKATTISLEPGEMVTADISLAAVPALHLRLTAPGLDLSQPHSLSISQSAFGDAIYSNTPEAWRDADSIGIVGVPPGEVRINVQGGGENKAPILFNATLNASQGMEINLNQQARGVSVSGMAKIPKGAYLPEQALLILREVDTGQFSQARFQPDGRFDFGDFVAPGRYLLSFANGLGWYVAGVQADGAEVSAHVVDLQSADPVRLTVELSEGIGRIEGVALRDGKGEGGAMILLVSKELGSQEVPGGGSVVRRDQSDSDGTFAMANVPPGEYTVLAIENGWEQDWGDPEILQGWLSGGTAVRVGPNGKASVQVNVQ